MGSIYKRTVQRGPRKGKPAKKWTIEYRLANGRPRRETAYTDKQASEQLLAQREREVARGEVGMVDPHREHRQLPILEHVDDYKRKLTGEGCTPAWIKKVGNQLTRAFRHMGAATLTDATMSSAMDYLAGLVADEGLSLTTRNQHASTLHAFGAWLLDSERLPRNPFERVQQIKVTDADRTHEPRVFDADELRRLCEASPIDRRRLYLFTAYTGFRANEDRVTTWNDVAIDTDSPTVTIRDTKNGDTVVVNIPPWLAQDLRQHRAETKLRRGGKLAGTARVFQVPKKPANNLRKDAAKAGLGAVRKVAHRTPSGNRWYSYEWVDPAGPKVRLDFHDLRAFFCTLLFEQGVPLHEVKRLCRHASIRTTEKHYTAWREARLRDAVDSLPNPMDGGPVSVPVSVMASPREAARGRRRPPGESGEGGQSLA